MARIFLDNNELAYLRVLSEVDPNGEQWIAHWASGLDFESHGADVMACSYNGSYSVMRRLRERKLVDSEPGRLSHDTGVAINDKGRQALAEAEAT